MECSSSPTRPAKFYTILRESVRAFAAAESSQEMHFLFFVIVRFVKLLEGIMFKIFCSDLCSDLSLCTVAFKINKVFDFKINQIELFLVNKL